MTSGAISELIPPGGLGLVEVPWVAVAAALPPAWRDAARAAAVCLPFPYPLSCCVTRCNFCCSASLRRNMAAVIFDLDGTLLDTESLSDEAMIRAVRDSSHRGVLL